MFTTYAIDLNSQKDTQATASTLDEALTHLRELLTSEIEDPNGPRFDRYGITIDKEAFAREHNTDELTGDPCWNAECLTKKHNVDGAFALGTLAELLAEDFRDLVTEGKSEWQDKPGHDEASYPRDCRKLATAVKRRCVMNALIRKVEAAHHELQANVLDRNNYDLGKDFVERARRQAKAAGLIVVLLKHALQDAFDDEGHGDDPSADGDDDRD